ncbi:MAG TPA: N-acetylglucosamine-6-phosphate deacetylase, partial [Firmicutes bacterium]|nr:N-acetylglucosamine-6-phosphate deacetylase [Bacillota bacterium]
MIIKNGIVFTDNCEFQKTDVTIEEDRIAGVGKSHSQADIDASNLYIIPGLVEIHMHGAMGFDFSDGTDEAFSQLAIFLIQRGVTSFLATSMSLPKPRLELI